MLISYFSKVLLWGTLLCIIAAVFLLIFLNRALPSSNYLPIEQIIKNSGYEKNNIVWCSSKNNSFLLRGKTYGALNTGISVIVHPDSIQRQPIPFPAVKNHYYIVLDLEDDKGQAAKVVLSIPKNEKGKRKRGQNEKGVRTILRSSGDFA